MKQTTETDDGTRVTVDTSNDPPFVIVSRDGVDMRFTGVHQDAIAAIRSGFSKMLDATAVNLARKS